MKQPIDLKGERVALRKPKRSDIVGLQATGVHNEYAYMCGDGAVAEVSYPKRAYWAKWCRAQGKGHGFAIEFEGRCIGGVRLGHISKADKNATFTIGIYDPALYGQGLGTQATRLMLRYGFETLGLHRVYLKVLDYNARGIRCYEKCGFVREGTFRDSAWIDGAWHSDVIMGILEDEYINAREATP